MYSNIKNWIFATILIICSSCDNMKKGNEYKESITKPHLSDTSFFGKQAIFKFWLSDTLTKFDTSATALKEVEGLVAKNISLLSDSLGVSVDLYFDLIVRQNRKTIVEGYPDKLLSLLKEYDESPKQNSKMKFTVHQFYSPSPVSGWKRDMIEELRDIQIIEPSNKVVSKYSFIRGRLSDKTTRGVDQNGTPIKEDIDFIWEGNKLVKRKLQ